MSTTDALLTTDDIELGLKGVQEMIDVMVTEKYAEGNEKTLQDVVNRICDIIAVAGKQYNYTDEHIELAQTALREGYFIPGGSILSGLKHNSDQKSSMSNCYVMKIHNDSIEGIFQGMCEMARTYSYRGGCGVDISVLRPNGTAVSNTAKYSTGAVSFMPMISSVTETIGQAGRRGAALISLDIAHPDIMRFIWCKADPARVLYKDRMNKTYLAKQLKPFVDILMNMVETMPEPARIATRAINEYVMSDGSMGSINGANISVRVSREFMQAVKEDKPWVCYFPDIAADKDLYNREWNGDYDHWKSVGGTLKEYTTYTACITKDNIPYFVGSTWYTHDKCPGHILTKEKIEQLLNENGGTFLGTFGLPSAREILKNLAQASWLRGDPGILFWDHMCEWSTVYDVHEDLKFRTTNPCFSLNTVVAVADGKGSRTFRSLIADGKDVPVYTRDDNGDLCIKMGRNPRITGYAENLIRVHFDNGSYQDVTPNHKFDLQSGETKRADELVPGDTMYPLSKLRKTYDEVIYGKTDKKRDLKHHYIFLKTEKKKLTAEHHAIFDYYHPGARVPGYSLHHKDKDVTNNQDSNLLLLTTREHQMLHAAERTGENNPIHRIDNPFNNPELQQWIRETYHIGATRSDETRKRISEAQKRSYTDESRRMAMIERTIAWHADPENKEKTRQSRIFVTQGYCKAKTDLPLIVVRHDDGSLHHHVVKVCEHCQKEFNVPFEYREQAFCSHHCSQQSVRVREEKRIRNLERYKEHRDNYPLIMQKQIEIYKQLCATLGRHATRLEFEEEAKSQGVPGRIYGTVSPFGTFGEMKKAALGEDQLQREHEEMRSKMIALYRDLSKQKDTPVTCRDWKSAASSAGVPTATKTFPKYGFTNLDSLKLAAATVNHKVVKTEVIPYNDHVCNITVDDTHALFTMTKFGHSDSGNGMGITEDFVYSRQCGELALAWLSACNLGAHVFSRYVLNMWTDNASFDWDAFQKFCKAAVILQNIFLDINKDRHPLETQRKADAFARRIGIEFTAFADMLSMLGYTYGNDQKTLSFVEKIMHLKAIVEMETSLELAKLQGPCDALNEDINPGGRQRFIHQPYVQFILDPTFSNVSSQHAYFLKDRGFNKTVLKGLSHAILTHGLRNTGFNCVGPTGSISVLANNCSSGIEPIFALSYRRRTRIGDKLEYTMCHAPLLKHLKETQQMGPFKIDMLKKKFHIVEAHELDYRQRIAMQSTVQRYHDGSISSTVNLPGDCTPEEIADIYLYAWEQKLKGITVYRAGSLDGVIVTNDTTNTTTATMDTSESVHVAHDLTDMVNRLRTFYETAMKEHLIWSYEQIREHRDLCTYFAPVVVSQIPPHGWITNVAYEALSSYEQSLFHEIQYAAVEHIRPISLTKMYPTETIPQKEHTDTLKRGELIKLPKQRPSVTHEVMWNGTKMYAVVSMDDHGNPMELFINLPREVSIDKNGVFNENDYQNKMSMWMALTRMISMTLRLGGSVSLCIKQMTKASFAINDPMSIVTRVLSHYDGTAGAKEATEHLTKSELADSRFTTICPNCGEKAYVREAGCSICRLCSFTKCD